MFKKAKMENLFPEISSLDLEGFFDRAGTFCTPLLDQKV